MLGDGDSFGEGALSAEASTRACTCQATGEDVLCLSLGKDNLMNILGDQLQNMIVRNILRWAIEKSKHLSKLVPMQKEQLYDLFKKKHYNAGEVILQKGKAVRRCVVICQNSNMLRSNDSGVIALKGQCFHDSFFIKSYRDKAFDENVIVEKEGMVFELYLEDLVKFLGGELEEVLKRNEKQSHEIKMSKMNRPK